MSCALFLKTEMKGSDFVVLRGKWSQIFTEIQVKQKALRPPQKILGWA